MRESGGLVDAARARWLGFFRDVMFYYEEAVIRLGNGKHVRDLREKFQNSKGKHWERRSAYGLL